MSAPINDNLADAILLTGASVSVDGTTVGSTIETGGAADDWEFGDGDVWYKWTTPINGIVTITPTGPSQFSGEVDVFIGTSFDDLEFINWGRFTESIQFIATAGVTYLIQVDTYSAIDFGAFNLSINVVPLPSPPANDNFADRIILSGTSFSAPAVNNQGATTEDFEDVSNYASIWYEYVSTADGTLNISLVGSDHVGTIKIYTGSFLRTLVLKGQNSTSISLAVRSGVSYKIVVCAPTNGFSARGNVVVTGTFVNELPLIFTNTNPDLAIAIVNRKGLVKDSAGTIFSLGYINSTTAKLAYSTDDGVHWTVDNSHTFTLVPGFAASYASGNAPPIFLDASSNILVLEALADNTDGPRIIIHKRLKSNGSWSTVTQTFPEINSYFLGDVDVCQKSDGTLCISISRLASAGAVNIFYVTYLNGTFSAIDSITHYEGSGIHGSGNTVANFGPVSFFQKARLVTFNNLVYLFWMRQIYNWDSGNPYAEPAHSFIGVSQVDFLYAPLSHNIDVESALDWATNKNYLDSSESLGSSFVKHNGSFYECIVSHLSGTFATDLAANKWALYTGYTNPTSIKTKTVNSWYSGSDTNPIVNPEDIGGGAISDLRAQTYIYFIFRWTGDIGDGQGDSIYFGENFTLTNISHITGGVAPFTDNVPSFIEVSINGDLTLWGLKLNYAGVAFKRRINGTWRTTLFGNKYSPLGLQTSNPSGSNPSFYFIALGSTVFVRYATYTCVTTNTTLNPTANMTPGATTGAEVIFTASQAYFKPEVVGQQIWKEAQNGVGKGRALIIEFISTTQVLCEILDDFDNTDTMLAGHWYLTTDEVIGLWHLEGETVRVQADGAWHPDCVVTNGKITLNYQASVIHVGLKYVGIIKSMNVEAGGVNGPAQTKPMNINRLGLRFLNTLGAQYGTNLYNMESVPFEDPQGTSLMPLPPFTGNKKLFNEDTTDIEKHIYVIQDKPLPCTVIGAVPFADTDNE